MRKIEFKVCYTNIADIIVTLFSSPFYETAEHFAASWEGGEKEVFIQKVWVKQ